MSAVGAMWIAVGVCTIAAAAEGLLAGSDVRVRFARLRLPRGSPPLPVWIGIGLAYYAIFFVVLFRVLRAGIAGRLTLALIVVILAANAGWNFLFFRAGSLFGALILSLVYSVVVLALLATLIRTDRVSALLVIAYAAYLVYANAWQYSLWRLNR